MNIAAFLEYLPSLLSTGALDESSVALIALVGGIVGGWTITGWRHQQLKARKIKIERKDEITPRKPE